MSTDIETRLKRAYLANGGTAETFESVKGELLTQYRHQATVNAALEEANRPPSMNELIRSQLQDSRSGKTDLLVRLLPPSKRGGSDDVA